MAANPLNDPKWAENMTDTIVSTVDKVRDRTTKPIVMAARGVVFGLLAAFLGLFIAVIEDLYRRFNEAEMALNLDVAQPEKALVDVVSFIWDYYQKNPEFITLLNDENLHRGKHIAKSSRAQDYSSPAIQILESVLASGMKKKVFREGLSGRDVYLMIASLNYFYLSNRFTLSAFLGEKLESPPALAHWHEVVVDTIMRAVKR